MAIPPNKNSHRLVTAAFHPSVEGNAGTSAELSSFVDGDVVACLDRIKHTLTQGRERLRKVCIEPFDRMRFEINFEEDPFDLRSEDHIAHFIEICERFQKGYREINVRIALDLVIEGGSSKADLAIALNDWMREWYALERSQSSLLKDAKKLLESIVKTLEEWERLKGDLMTQSFCSQMMRFLGNAKGYIETQIQNSSLLLEEMNATCNSLRGIRNFLLPIPLGATKV